MRAREIASAGVKREDCGLASGVINTSQPMGGALGLAALGSVVAAYTSKLLVASQTQLQWF